MLDDARFKRLRLIPYVLLFFTAFSFFSTSVDDPFITFRYAANFLAGHGLVFNPGQHVEADTSTLHVLVCVVLMWLPLGVGILFKAKLFSLLMASLMLWQTERLCRLFNLDNISVLASQTLVAISPNFAITAVNGLETSLFGFLLLAAVNQFICEIKNGKGNWSAVLLFLALLARPETALISVALLSVRFFAVRADGLKLSLVTSWATIFFGLSAAFIAARMAYYGLPLPNTYYAKLGVTQPAKGLHYLLWDVSKVWSMHSMLLVPAIAALVFWLLTAVGAYGGRKHWQTWCLCAVLFSEVAAVIRSNGDWMPGWRFMTPIYPEIVVLEILGILHIVEHFSRDILESISGTTIENAAAMSRAVSWAFLAVILLWIGVFEVCPKRPWSFCGYSTADRAMVLVGYKFGPGWVYASDLIHQTFPPGSVVAYSEMGYAGYTNPKITFLDTRGLTEPSLCKAYGPSNKSYIGITDFDWYKSTSPLFKFLNLRHPAGLLTFDFRHVYPVLPPKEVLGGYRFVSRRNFAIGPICLYVPVTQHT